MKSLLTVLAVCQLCLLAAACSPFTAGPDFKKMESYGFNASSTLAERVARPPGFLLEALKKADRRDDYLPYVPTQSDMQQIRAALDKLPPRQKSAMLSRLVGIYFVKNLSSGGYSDYIHDANGVLHTFLVLNPALLHTGMSRWIMEKELSAFNADKSDVAMNVDCGEGGGTALLYILLHESGHLLDYVAGCTPFVEQDLAKSGKKLSTVPFAATAWKEYGLPLAVFDYSGRSRLRFYGDDSSAKLSRSEMPAAYRALSATPFMLLYASQNWAEDFAETVAFSELKRIFGRGCSIQVKGPGGDSFRFDLLERKVAADRLPLLYSSCSAILKPASRGDAE